jgi:hypothetical protein
MKGKVDAEVSEGQPVSHRKGREKKGGEKRENKNKSSFVTLRSLLA